MSTPPTPRTQRTALAVAAALGLTTGAAALAAASGDDADPTTEPVASATSNADTVRAAAEAGIIAAPPPSGSPYPAGDALAQNVSQRAAAAAALVVDRTAPVAEEAPAPAPEPEPEPEHEHQAEPEPEPEHEHQAEPAPRGNGREYAGADGVGTYNGATYSWDDLAQCESGGNWSSTAGTYEGGLQFHPQTWDAYKDPGMPDAAYEATRVQQMAIAEYVLDDQSWDAWPACSSKLGWR